ncbi:MAG: hypothetical protein K2W85_11240 [Phycisphaerales bacterium]|nr:hypothetical protein [Phycisphaerales bacterium]
MPSSAEIQSIRTTWIESLEFEKEYNKPETDELTRKRIRNDAISNRIRFVDWHYSQLEDELRQSRSSIGFTSDAAVLTLNAVGTLVGPASTKAILHAISAGVVGTRSSFEKNYFFDQTTQVIIPKMQALRAEVRLEIEGQWAKPTADYPLSKALHDVDRYFRAGSVIMALMSLTNDTGAAAKKAEDEVRDVVRQRLLLPATDDQITTRERLTSRLLSMTPDQAKAILSALNEVEVPGRGPIVSVQLAINTLVAGKQGENLTKELQRISKIFDDAGVK